jgi:hypothetical protein
MYSAAEFAAPHLTEFAKLLKAIIFAMSLCPSVHMDHLGSQWSDFHEILYVDVFRKSVEVLQSLIPI